MSSRFWCTGMGVYLALALIAPRSAQAQQTCLDFHGIMQSRFDNTFGWVGTLYGVLGQERVTGVLVGADPGTSSQTGVVGHDKGVVVTWEYTGVNGTIGRITTEQHGVYPMPPGKAGLGYYQGIATIVSGTGRFENSSGNMVFGGPYLLWLIDPQNPASGVDGRWNAEISGKVCGVREAARST